MRTLLSFLIAQLLCFSIADAHGQTFAQSDLDVNNVSARISVNGNHFWDHQAISYYQIPKGSQKTTLFTNTFWIGGKDSVGQLHLSAERYMFNGGDYTTGPLSTDGLVSTDQTTINDYNRFWIVYRHQIEDHQAWTTDPASMPNYSIPAVFLNWPAHGDTTRQQDYYLAPFTDVDGDGHYNPQKGDHPKIRGDKALYFIFNDAGCTNMETNGFPMGVEVHGMAYAFGCLESHAFHNSIFMHYRIINRSKSDYSDTYIGLFTDFDLGYAYDDYIGSDVQRGSIFAYNGLPTDGHGKPEHYSHKPPAQGLTLLAGPYMDADNLDNPSGLCDESINGMNFGNGIADDERLGLTRFIALNNTGSGLPATTDPFNDYDYYHYMQGKWKDSSYIKYGGDGYSDTTTYGPPCRFMFPGNSDPCHWGTAGVVPNGPVDWNEVSEGHQPFDRRGLAVTGPFTFEAGSVHELDFAFVYGRDREAPDSIAYLAAVEQMKQNIDTIRKAFQDNITPCGQYIITGVEDMQRPRPLMVDLYPNPADNVLYLKSGLEDNYGIEIYNLLGKRVVSKEYEHSPVTSININHLPRGLYILRLTSGGKEVVRKFVKQ